jgi:ATP-binding cassette, subfamily C, bacterial CydC
MPNAAGRQISGEGRDELRPLLRLMDDRTRRELAAAVLLGSLAYASTVGLLGVAGWFITLSALSGLVGTLTFSLFLASGGVRALALTRVLGRYAERVTAHRATFTWLARLRVHFFQQALQLPASQVARFRTGDLLGRAVAEVDALDQFPLRVVLPTASAVVVAVGALGFLAFQAPAVATVAAVWVGLAGGGVPLLSAALGRRPGAASLDARARLRTELVDGLEGAREIAAYGAQRHIAAHLAGGVAEVERRQAHVDCMSARSAAAGTAATGTAMFLALTLGLAQVAGGALTAPIFAAMCFVVLALFDGLEPLTAAYQQLGVIRRAGHRLHDIFATAEGDGRPVGRSVTLQGADLRLCGVSFRYPGQSRPVLHDITLVAPAGSLVTITGRSGTGKSTLLRLCARELEPDAGQISLAMAPLQTIDLVSFWRGVGYVAHDSHIFAGSLRDNMLLGAPTATDGELSALLAVVGLTDLVRRLRYGLDTLVGEQGDNLSGGERRRLCVARAALRRPSLLLLDEPAAGVDAAAAQRMLQNLRVYLASSTIVVAGHEHLPLRADVSLALPDPAWLPIVGCGRSRHDRRLTGSSDLTGI